MASIYGKPLVGLSGSGAVGAGGKFLYSVTLPRSIYYEQAAEWLKIKDEPSSVIPELNWDGQVVCGGSLWLLKDNKAEAYSLEDGSLLETNVLTSIQGGPVGSITTDGESRIWFLRAARNYRVSRETGAGITPTYVHANITLFLYEFDINTKSYRQLNSQALPEYKVFAGSKYAIGFKNSSEDFVNFSILGYSKTSNTLYWGKFAFKTTVSYNYTTSNSGNTFTGNTPIESSITDMYKYNLQENENTPIASFPVNDIYGNFFCYDESDFLYTGMGYNKSSTTKYIYRYNKQSNTWEVVNAAAEGNALGPFAYINLGDKVLCYSKTTINVFDPKTGSLETGSVPQIPPDDEDVFSGFKAYANNILYLRTSKGIYKCPFYSSVPEDAPIVAKIYKGQKYHTLEPFEIPNKVKFLRTQQTAIQDIEIKMYEYSSEGGQTIYIENVGEE